MARLNLLQKNPGSWRAAGGQSYLNTDYKSACRPFKGHLIDCVDIAALAGTLSYAALPGGPAAAGQRL